MPTVREAHGGGEQRGSAWAVCARLAGGRPRPPDDRMQARACLACLEPQLSPVPLRDGACNGQAEAEAALARAGAAAKALAQRGALFAAQARTVVFDVEA